MTLLDFCASQFSFKSRRAATALEDEHSPPWAQRHPALTALLGVHSTQRNIPQNIFFHSVKLWRQMLLKTPEDRHEVIVMEIQSERGVQTTWAGDPSPQGFSSVASHSPGDHRHRKWGCLHQGGFDCIFLLTQVQFCSSSSRSSCDGGEGGKILVKRFHLREKFTFSAELEVYLILSNLTATVIADVHKQ